MSNKVTAEIEFGASVADSLERVRKAIAVSWRYYTQARPPLEQFEAAVALALLANAPGGMPGLTDDSADDL